MRKIAQKFIKNIKKELKMDASIVILAAGKGTRFKSMTPKVLHKICGKEMLFYSIRAALSISNQVCVILGHEAQKIKDALNEHFSDQIAYNKLSFIEQDIEQEPGTGGALRAFINATKGQNPSKVLVLNGDMPLVGANDLLKFLESSAEFSLSVAYKKGAKGYGRVFLRNLDSIEFIESSKEFPQNVKVEKIIEEKDALKIGTSSDFVNAGVYCFSREILEKYLPKLQRNNEQNEFYLTDIIGLASADGCEISPILVDLEQFFGVNDKAELASAECKMCDQIRQKWLKAGVIMRLPETIYIEDSVQFVGECVLENGVCILGNSRIENSIIKAHSVVDNAEIIDCGVGPFARVRPNSVLKLSAIGNFVEIKASSLHGVKAGHLSYIGDCEIERGSNVGAGFITCNYDGRGKHRTKIGSDVFIGSGVQIVAPCEVGDNVIIGAGSTLRSNVESGELFITKGEEVRKKGFFEKYFAKK